MKTIGITGGTGFAGRHLTKLLVDTGYDVVVLTRDASGRPAGKQVTYVPWNPEQGNADGKALRPIDAIVNLAGAGIADKRWTRERKLEIERSRVQGTEFLIEQLKTHAPACTTFVSASAAGYYGADAEGKIPFTEASEPADDFLGNVCKKWEDASQKASAFARTVIFRFGIVLGKDGGAFPKLAQPMKFGIMPIAGSGKQMVSWIAVDDLARLLLFGLENNSMSGVYNAVTADAVTHKELMRTIAREMGGLKIPAPAPAFALKILLGDMSEELLKSCTVSAAKTLESGFTFRYPDLVSAVKALV